MSVHYLQWDSCFHQGLTFVAFLVKGYQDVKVSFSCLSSEGRDSKSRDMFGLKVSQQSDVHGWKVVTAQALMSTWLVAPILGCHWLLLRLVTSLFLVTDEGFVYPCVGGNTSVYGWLRYFETQVINITRISVPLNLC